MGIKNLLENSVKKIFRGKMVMTLGLTAALGSFGVAGSVVDVRGAVIINIINNYSQADYGVIGE